MAAREGVGPIARRSASVYGLPRAPGLEPGYSQTHHAFEVLGAQDGCQMVVGLVLAEMQKSCGTNPTVCTPSPGGAQYTVRVHVRADACGTIIGKGGATINQMRSASGAQIKVRDCHLSDDL